MIGEAVHDVLDRLAGVDPKLAALAAVLHLLNHLLRSVAWRAVLAAAFPSTPVRLAPVASAYAAGVALNAVLPARGGDAAKVAFLRMALPGSALATIAATMSILVLFDAVMATALTIMAAASGLVPLRPQPPGVDPGVVTFVMVAVGVVLAVVAVRLIGPRLHALWAQIRQGGAILRTPRRYATAVALPQAGAWCSRVGVVFCLLRAFDLPATVPLAATVMILAGVSTLVPLTPGGAGTQQVLIAFALGETASAAALVSFSVGMQAGTTVVNALLGIVAAMALAHTTRPLAALRALRRPGRLREARNADVVGPAP